MSTAKLAWECRHGFHDWESNGSGTTQTCSLCNEHGVTVNVSFGGDGYNNRCCAIADGEGVDDLQGAKVWETTTGLWRYAWELTDISAAFDSKEDAILDAYEAL